MNWIINHWGWLAGIGLPVIALIALAVFAPGAAIKLLHEVADAALSAARWLVKWARKNGWRTACFLVAIAALGWTWSLQGKFTAERDKAIAFEAASIAIARERNTVIGERDASRKEFADFKASLADKYREVNRQVERQKEQAAGEIERLEADNARASAIRAEWQRQRDAKGDVCRAVREALDANAECFKDY